MAIHLRRSICNALTIVVVVAVCVVMIASARGQSAPTVQPSSPSAPLSAPVPDATGNQQPAGAAAIRGTSAAPIKEAKEIKETKETKEVKENPEWFVGLANAFAALAGAVAWPLALFGALYMLSRNVSLADVKEMFGVVKPLLSKIKVGGVELELNLEALRERGEQTGEAFDDLVLRADKEYQVAASQQELGRHLTTVMRDALPSVLLKNKLNANPPEVRSTIYVPDIVFKDYLYQLTDYFPDRDVGGPAGRRFSQRFGIIGRAWRLGTSMGRGNAVDAIGDLIERWGMTYEEANKSRSRANPADLCIILRNQDEGIPIGLLFIDSSQKDAFGANVDPTPTISTANTVATDLGKTTEAVALASALARAVVPLRTGAPNLAMARSLK
jgi:hypothetical protein